MSQWSEYNGEYSLLFYHLSRHSELVVLKDRDVMAFTPETALKDATDGMKIWRDKAHTFKQWETASTEKVLQSERVFLWSRICGTEIVSGFRWVPYITSRDVDAANIKPLREVFAPRIAYDRSSNMLHLWFWTNVYWPYMGTDYDESQLVPIGTQGYQQEMGFPDNPVKNLKRVLCYATGMLGHWYIEGGFISGFTGLQTVTGPQGTEFDSNIYDLVPVFTLPRIITNFAPAAGTGMITDGWYEPQGNGLQGPQGYQGPDGPCGPIGFREPQGNQGVQGLQGPQGYQGAQGTQGCLECEPSRAFRNTLEVYYPFYPYFETPFIVAPECWKVGERLCVTTYDPITELPTGVWAETIIDSVFDTGSPTYGWVIRHQFGGFGTFPNAGDRVVVCHGSCLLGFQGIQGLQGVQGFQGYRGEVGPFGPRGLQGPMGNQGDAGMQGQQGWKGPKGYIGWQGPQGFMGFQGPQGYRGFQGIQGIQGCPNCMPATWDNGDVGSDEYALEPWTVYCHCWKVGDRVCFTGNSGVSAAGTVDGLHSGGRAHIDWDNPTGSHQENGTMCHGECNSGPQGYQGYPGCPSCMPVTWFTGVVGNDMFSAEPWWPSISDYAHCWVMGEKVCFKTNKGGIVATGTVSDLEGGGLVGIDWDDPLGSHQSDGTLCHGDCHGIQGSQGYQGPQGPELIGLQGYQGEKLAIVKTSNGYIELACVEAPEVLFFDILRVHLDGLTGMFSLDKLFLEVCEPDSIRILSAVPEEPVRLSAELVMDNSFRLSCAGHASTDVTVMVSGVRKGFTNRRFTQRTRRDYDRNMKFWNKQWTD